LGSGTVLGSLRKRVRDGFGVMAIAVLCYIFLSLPLNIMLLLVIPVAAILMSVIGAGGHEDEQEP